jgi:hypothetical protein
LAGRHGYPAPVIKLFFMVETFHQGKISSEIERVLREVIQVSDNDAAAFLLDTLTDTSSGSELDPKALNDFAGVIRDTQRNLDLFSFVAEHADREE